MSKNLKKRINTSILLIVLLFFMFKKNYILGYFLIVLGVLSSLELFKMNSIILKNQIFKNLFYNSIFFTYIFCFCSIIFILSSFIHLKIILFTILLICIGSDIGGFIFGKIFKGKKLTKLSPKKTVSGAFGSLVFSSATSSFLFFYITGKFNFNFILIGLLISISCQLGDLYFSYLKRKSFLKDTGNLLPGHGGILDRIDGILFGIPIGLLTLFIFY